MVFWSKIFEMLKQPRLSESIISEIIWLEYSSFFWKISKFHAYYRNAIKNPEKFFCFVDNEFEIVDVSS